MHYARHIVVDFIALDAAAVSSLCWQMSASAEYHIDEQARLLQKVANDTPAITWVLQNCFGHRKEKATPPVEGTRQIPEDYGQDDNSWQDAP